MPGLRHTVRQDGLHVFQRGAEILIREQVDGRWHVTCQHCYRETGSGVVATFDVLHEALDWYNAHPGSVEGEKKKRRKAEYRRRGRRAKALAQETDDLG